MVINKITWVIVFACVAGCATTGTTTVGKVADSPQTYDGKEVTVKGYLVTDELYIPHVFASQAEALKPRNEEAGLDLLPSNKTIDKQTRVQTVTCVIVHGVFHAPVPHSGLGTLTSKIGALEIDSIKQC